jgi:hypothetical protein
MLQIMQLLNFSTHYLWIVFGNTWGILLLVSTALGLGERFIEKKFKIPLWIRISLIVGVVFVAQAMAYKELTDAPPIVLRTPTPPAPIISKEETPPKPNIVSKPPTPGNIKQGGNGDCQANSVGGNSSVENSCNNGPPPLVLKVVSVEAGASVMAFMPKEGFIQTDITIVPNQEVTAPFTIELDFDNPIADIAHTVKNVGTNNSGGPFRIGIHARETVSTGIGPSHPLIVGVFSLQPVKLVGGPRIVF